MDHTISREDGGIEINVNEAAAIESGECGDGRIE